MILERADMDSNYKLLILVCACILCANKPGAAQNGLEDEGLREFVDGPGGASALTGGNRGFYVKNQANGIPSDVLYDHPDGLQSELVHTNGKGYSAKARFYREFGKVEMWYGGRSYFVDGDVFPYVKIGDNIYAYNDYGTGEKPVMRFGKLVAGSSETDFQILRSYMVTRMSNTPSSNAFSQADVKTYRIDSTDIMIGDRPFAQEVDKRRRFRASLTPCAADAHQAALSVGRFRTDAYYNAFIKELQADCRRAEDARK